MSNSTQLDRETFPSYNKHCHFHCIHILRTITINRNNVVCDYAMWLAVGSPHVIAIVIQYEHDQNVIYSAENL